ncbi:NAD(P)H-binding protein [Pseudaquabacterium terrae]|uniref:NAD(P)H-binding protein n=1 Tax=Pseudaquabacterium terrae TaxID=2732868 RepID=UPI0031B5EF89
MADTERQEAAVRASGLDRTLIQPVHLTDDAGAGELLASLDGALRSLKIARRLVGRCLADALRQPAWLGGR